MIEIGCLANFNYPYKSEIDFAIENNFKLVQIWYDKNGISLLKDQDPIDIIRAIKFPAIIHAVLDINDFDAHIPRILKILVELGHIQQLSINQNANYLAVASENTVDITNLNTKRALTSFDILTD